MGIRGTGSNHQTIRLILLFYNAAVSACGVWVGIVCISGAAVAGLKLLNKVMPRLTGSDAIAPDTHFLQYLFFIRSVTCVTSMSRNGCLRHEILLQGVLP